MPSQPNFDIRAGYAHRPDNDFFDDTPFTDEYQREVYELALDVGGMIDARSVVDVGCGSAFKLMKHFSHMKTIGLDLEPTLTFLRNTYPDRDWRVSDFTAPVDPADLVICADVVEHIPDPDQLMAFLQRITAGRLIISTPERQLVYGHDHAGPPRNRAHCREWTITEFQAYVGRWFDIQQATITNQPQGTQALVCAPSA